jgi:hypothetical protein
MTSGRRKEALMDTKVNEIASGIYRLLTFVPEIAPPAGRSRSVPWPSTTTAAFEPRSP